MRRVRAVPFVLALVTSTLSLGGCCFPNIWGGGPQHCRPTQWSFSSESLAPQFPYSLRSGCDQTLEVVDRDGDEAAQTPVLEASTLFNYVVDPGGASKGITTARRVSLWARPSGQNVPFRGGTVRLTADTLTLVPLRCPAGHVVLGPGEPEPAPARPAASAREGDWKTFLRDAP